MRASGILAIVLFAVGSAQASYVYDFSYTGSNSYNVVFVEPSLITTAGSFAFSPFVINGNTFTQGFFDPRCSAFSFATSDGSADDCGATAGAGAEGFFLQYDSPPTSPGVYSTLEAAGVGINPGNAPDQLTITEITAPFLYTLAYTGSNPYAVFFGEPSLITTAGSFAFSPFAINGNTFTQGFFDPRCSAFSFATSDGSADDCGATAGAGAEGFFLQYDSPPTSPGVYSTLEAAGVGINPGNAPDQLTITSLVATPEPSTLCLIGLAACLLTPSICKLRPEGRTGMLNRLQERQGPEDDRLRRWGRAGIFRGEREVEVELGKCDNVGAGRTHGPYVR